MGTRFLLPAPEKRGGGTTPLREDKTGENGTDLKQAWQPNALTAPFHFKTITLQAACC